MANKTKIEWTDATWNPITGCSIVSPGCTNCYAMRHAGTRGKHHPSRKGLTKQVNGNHVWTGEVRFNEKWLTQPLHWRKPRMIFVCAHGDLFHEDVPDEWIDRVFAVMALCPQHTFQVLTKRAERMREYLRRANDNLHHPAKDYAALMATTGQWDTPAINLKNWPLPNVWLGVSIEDQKTADERIPFLLDTPAAVRFISAEPLLEPVDLTQIWAHLPSGGRCLTDALAGTQVRRMGSVNPGRDWDSGDYWIPGGEALDWVIVGGESGHKARPMHPDWARSLRDQCANAEVPFLFKQWGAWAWSPDEMNFGEGKQWAKQLKAKDVLFASSGHTGALISKTRAGRMLDGVEHNGMPEART